MQISPSLTGLALSLLTLSDFAFSFPTSLPHHSSHGDFHKMRAVQRRTESSPNCATTVGNPGGVGIKIQNHSPNGRVINVTPASHVQATSFAGDITVCPGQDVMFYPCDKFNGVLKDMKDLEKRVQGAMLELNIEHKNAWWDVSLTRGQSNMVVTVENQRQGEEDYMKKANDAWWRLPHDTRQDYNHDTPYIKADGSGIHEMWMDACDKDPDADNNRAYQNAIQFMQVDANFQAYVARGTPWGKSKADRLADEFSYIVEDAVTKNAEFVMQLF